MHWKQVNRFRNNANVVVDVLFWNDKGGFS